MEFLGTKGKWYIKKAEPCDHQRISIKTDDVLCVGVNDSDGGFISMAICGNSKHEVVKANALLISKCPEMLEMLKELFLILKSVEGHEETIKEVNQLIKEATELN